MRRPLTLCECFTCELSNMPGTGYRIVNVLRTRIYVLLAGHEKKRKKIVCFQTDQMNGSVNCLVHREVQCLRTSLGFVIGQNAGTNFIQKLCTTCMPNKRRTTKIGFSQSYVFFAQKIRKSMEIKTFVATLFV